MVNSNGGNKDDRSHSIAIDRSGSIYMTGVTESSSFHTTDNSTHHGRKDVFIARFNSNGNLAWSTLLGGDRDDYAEDIAIDNDSRNFYITGFTLSSNFGNAGHNNFSGKSDTFIAKYGLDGNIKWLKLIGGKCYDNAHSLDVDTLNNVYITGFTNSSNFPVTDSSTLSGDTDIFIAKFNSSGDIVWSKLIGGNQKDFGFSIATDSNNNIVVTGATSSSDFPTTDGSSHWKYYDIFITKFNSDGNTIWSTLLAGEDTDYSTSVVIDNNNCIYITGTTTSSNFPVTDSSSYSGSDDVVIAKYDSNGTKLWATYLGGLTIDRGNDITLDNEGIPYITGYTNSYNFLHPDYSKHADFYDVFIVRYSSNGSMQWGTLVGGTGSERGLDIALDNQNSVIVTGYTYSVNFPTTDNSTFKGERDVFVSKFSANGNLQWSTLLGGEYDEKGYGVSTDFNNNIVVTGYTSSQNFPVTDNSSNNGGMDIFLTKFNTNGNIVWSTLLGGVRSETARSISISKTGYIFITGITSSSDFPVTDNSNYSDGWDTFIAKYNSNGTKLWATFLGGSGNDIGNSIATDNSENIYITGDTESSDFPVTDNSNYSDNGDIFIAKYNSNGTKLWATYLGGNDTDSSGDIAVDSSGNAYITGFTRSSNFPVTDNSNNISGTSAFLVKYSTNGIKQWATLLDGAAYDSGNSLVVDKSNNIFLTGNTYSYNFPVTNGTTLLGGWDIFITKYYSNGVLQYSTLFGGSNDDFASAIAIDKSENFYIVGFTKSSDFPISSNAYDNQNSIGYDVFISKLSITSSFFKHLGGPNNESAKSVIKTSNGAYIVAGYTSSYTNGNKKIALYKLDGSGNVKWYKRIGGSNDAECYSIIETSDGGYVLCGYTTLKPYNDKDVAVYKFNKYGYSEWYKPLGDIGDEEGYSIIQTSDGGYAIVGYTTSYTNGGKDALIYKLDENGNIEWYKHFGGTEDEEIKSIVELSDGGYLLCGYSSSFATGNLGYPDVAIYKLDENGNKVWFKHLGGNQAEEGTSIVETSDGGYAVLGYTTSYSNGGKDIALWKFDSSNNKQWFKHFGGSNDEEGNTLILTDDGGYAFCGYTSSYSNGGKDIVLFKLNSNGNKEFFKHYGGGNNETGYSLIQIENSGYLIVGETNSYSYGGYDMAIYKLKSDGTK